VERLIFSFGSKDGGICCTLHGRHAFHLFYLNNMFHLNDSHREFAVYVVLRSSRWRREREREIYFKSHVSLWEHSSHFRLIGRGVPSVSVVSQLMYKFLCLASPKENPQVPM